jgi:hypothetical protein
MCIWTLSLKTRSHPLRLDPEAGVAIVVSVGDPLVVSAKVEHG